VHADPHLRREPLCASLVSQAPLYRDGALQCVAGICERDKEPVALVADLLTLVRG